MALSRKKWEEGLQRLGFARSERGIFHKTYGSGSIEVMLFWDKEPKLYQLKRPMRVPAGTPNPEPEMIILPTTDLRSILPPDCLEELAKVAKIGSRSRRKAS